jgi:RNA polymerase sigma-70 factor (ECF subfamily)
MAHAAGALPRLDARPQTAVEVDPRIQRAVDGDVAAAQALLVEMTPRIRNLMRYMVRGDDRVDDLAQEALLAIYRALPKYQASGSFKAWTHTVATRAALSSLRKMKRHRRDIPVDNPDVIPIGLDTREHGRYFEKRKLARLLDRLSDEQRMVLVLHHSVGMTTEEVAEHLGVPHETVRSRLRLARQRLRSMLPKTEGGRP